MQGKRRTLFDWHSLRTRLTAGVLLAVVLSLWMATLAIGHYLRQDMEAAIWAQQFSTVSLVARDVDNSVRERVRAVEGMAAQVTAAMLDDPAAVQRYLEQQVVAAVMFNWGTVVLDRHGRAVASVPESLDRGGTDYSDIDFVRDTLVHGVAMISDPRIGRRTGEPVVGITAPIRDRDGVVIGLVAGAINLARPNFLDEISAAKYGKTGDFLLTAPRNRVFVAASDKRRVMKEGPPRGVNPMYDSYIDGFEGSGVALSSRGVVELSSSKRIPSTGWLMQSVLPTAEAFAPIRALQQRLIGISLLLTVLAGAIAWWWLRHQLSPLEEAAVALARMRDGAQPRQPLPVRRDDEIGELARAFNGLLEAILAEEELAAEHRANQRLRKIVARVPGVVFQYRRDADGRGSFPFASDALLDLFGVAPEEVVDSAAKVRELLHPDDEARFFASLHASAENVAPWRIEYRIRRHDGSVKWVLVDAVPERSDDGVIVWYGSIADVTEAKAMEEELRIAAATFEGQEGIIITDADAVIIRVNHAFSAMTGYSAAEAIGRTPALLRSGRHDEAFYRQLWTALARDGYWRGELWNRRKSGELFAEWATISAVKDAEGRVTHYVAAFSDITEQKQAEEQIHRLAFYDPLTNLPNRRLFLDRLEQGIAGAVRNHTFGAVMFIDLDEFKSLNDRHGHIMGDKLLLQAAQRLGRCVRASDTVARLGGDEFMVMLHDVATLVDGVHSAAAQAHAVALKIRGALSEPYRLEPVRAPLGPAVIHRCTASIGISLFDGDSPSRDELIRQADIAMYAAKTAGRNTIRFFDAALGGQLSEAH